MAGTFFDPEAYAELGKGYLETASDTNRNNNNTRQFSPVTLNCTVKDADPTGHLSTAVKKCVEFVARRMIQLYPELLEGPSKRGREWIVTTSLSPHNLVFAAFSAGRNTDLYISRNEVTGRDDWFKHPAFDLDIVAHELMHVCRCFLTHLRGPSIRMKDDEGKISDRETEARLWGTEEGICDYFALCFTTPLKEEIMGKDHGFSKLCGALHGFYCRNLNFKEKSKGPKLRGCKDSMEVCLEQRKKKKLTYRCAKRDYEKDVEAKPKWISDPHYHGKKLAKSLLAFRRLFKPSEQRNFDVFLWATFRSTNPFVDVGDFAIKLFEKLLVEVEQGFASKHKWLTSRFENEDLFDEYFPCFYREGSHAANVGLDHQREELLELR